MFKKGKMTTGGYCTDCFHELFIGDNVFVRQSRNAKSMPERVICASCFPGKKVPKKSSFDLEVIFLNKTSTDSSEARIRSRSDIIGDKCYLCEHIFASGEWAYECISRSVFIEEILCIECFEKMRQLEIERDSSAAPDSSDNDN